MKNINFNFNNNFDIEAAKMIESHLYYLLYDGEDVEFLKNDGMTVKMTELINKIKLCFETNLDSYIKSKEDEICEQSDVDSIRKRFDISKKVTPRQLHLIFESMNIDYDKIHRERIEKLDVYSTADDNKFNKLVDTFVSNFGFSDPDFTSFALKNWFKASKCIMSYNDEVSRSMGLIFVSPNNFTGKSTIQDCIAQAFAESFITNTHNTDLERMTGQFSFLPTQPSPIILNEAHIDNKMSSCRIKDIIGNQPVDINQKGVRNLIHSENRNIYIGSSNEFVHLRNMQDTRFLNIPLDRLKYTTKHHKNAKRQIIDFVKEIIKYAPACDGDEISNIISKLNDWNNQRGDDEKWKTLLYELYTIENPGNLSEDWDAICDTQTKDSIGEWLRKIVSGASSKGAIAGKIADIIVEKHGLDSKFKSIYQSQIMKSDLIVRAYPGSTNWTMTINESFFDGFTPNENDNDLESLLPWSQSPIYNYFYPLPDLDPTPDDHDPKFYGCDDARYSSQVGEVTFEDGTQYIVVNEPTDEAKANATFDRMSGKNTISRCTDNFKMNRFIFESDTASLEEQMRNAKRIEPVAMSCVYSGGKSYHIIINTNYKGHDKDCYKFLYRKIAKALFPDIKHDKQLEGDTIRLCRKPNGFRKDDKHQNVNQTLVYFHPDHKIDVSRWLEEYEFDKQFQTRTQKATKLNDFEKKEFKNNDYHNLPAVKEAIAAKQGERESLANRACYSMKQNGYEDYIIDMLNECPLDSDDRNNLIKQYAYGSK